MQAAEQRPHPAPFLGALELAELPRRAVGERFHANRIPRVDTAQDRPATGRDRRQNELQSGVTERGRRAKGPIEHLEDVIGDPAGVGPASEVVGAHEPPQPSAPTASQWWLPKPIGR